MPNQPQQPTWHHRLLAVALAALARHRRIENRIRNTRDQLTRRLDCVNLFRRRRAPNDVGLSPSYLPITQLRVEQRTTLTTYVPDINDPEFAGPVDAMWLLEVQLHSHFRPFEAKWVRQIILDLLRTDNNNANQTKDHLVDVLGPDSGPLAAHIVAQRGVVICGLVARLSDRKNQSNDDNGPDGPDGQQQGASDSVPNRVNTRVYTYSFKHPLCVIPNHLSLCPICHEDYVPAMTLRRLPCGHDFHTQCIDEWLTKYKARCPKGCHSLFSGSVKPFGGGGRGAVGGGAAG